MRRAWSIVGGLALGAVLVGCLIVTGDTDDYKPLPATAALCRAAADCNGNEAGPLLCCITLDDGGSPTLACQTSCALPKYQSCGGEAECGDTGTCSPHTCTVPVGNGSVTLTISTCGQSPCR